MYSELHEESVKSLHALITDPLEEYPSIHEVRISTDGTWLGVRVSIEGLTYDESSRRCRSIMHHLEMRHSGKSSVSVRFCVRNKRPIVTDHAFYVDDLLHRIIHLFRQVNGPLPEDLLVYETEWNLRGLKNGCLRI